MIGKCENCGNPIIIDDIESAPPLCDDCIDFTGQCVRLFGFIAGCVFIVRVLR